MSVSEPGKIITPWAESGLKNPIPPAANPTTGRAGFDQGFPAINMTAKEAGGIPPFGQDFNGIFYEVTNILRYMQAGGQPTFNAALATAIGGYPKGAMVLGSDGVTLWQSKVGSNSTDPNVDPTNWGTFDIGLKSDLALPSGAGIIGGLMTPITAASLAGGAVSGQDSTAAIEAAGAIGGTYWVPKGEYIISSAQITKDVTFIFEKGASFKRAPGLDIHQSTWNPGVPMIDVVADGLTVTFIDPTFDGNKLNQPAVQVGYVGPNATTEPVGWAFRYSPVNPVTAKDCRFNFIRPKFKNGTSGYVLVRGDDVNRRFKTTVVMDNPEFSDTIYGYGSGDPATPTALGWMSIYVSILDYVDLFALNPDMHYLAGPTPIGRYAPVGIVGSYFGSDAALAGGASIYCLGTTRLRGMGRKLQKYDGSSPTGNNAIGAIDCYGVCRDLYVDIVSAKDNEFTSVRAKATIDTFRVNEAILTNCIQGVEVTPTPTVTQDPVIHVGSIVSKGGWNPQLQFVGNTAGNKIPSVHVGQAYISGGINGHGSTGVIAGIVFRYVSTVTHGLLTVKDQDEKGVQYFQCDVIDGSCDTSDTAKIGVLIDAASDKIDLKATVKNAGGHGVSIVGTCKSLKVSANVDGSVDYGVMTNLSDGHTHVENSVVANVSGSSRGYYMGVGAGTISGSSTKEGVTTPLLAADSGQVNQYDNSWNPRNALYRASVTAPTTGEYRKGDILYIPPTPGGYVGWVCTVAGTAGSTAVFKRFGVIEV